MQCDEATSTQLKSKFQKKIIKKMEIFWFFILFFFVEILLKHCYSVWLFYHDCRVCLCSKFWLTSFYETSQRKTLLYFSISFCSFTAINFESLEGNHMTILMSFLYVSAHLLRTSGYAAHRRFQLSKQWVSLIRWLTLLSSKSIGTKYFVVANYFWVENK